MKMTLSVLEINEFLRGQYKDPHAIMGTHVISPPNQPTVTVERVFVPQAKAVTVLDPATGESWPARKQHIEGFFEAICDRSEWFRCKLLFEGHSGEKWESYDPYTFAPTLSNEDIHLIAEGTCHFLFKKLGANVKTVEGVPGTAFAFYAPDADGVSVIGSFNCWDERRGQMRLLNGSGIWELFVPDASVGDRYKFKIRKSGIITEVLDPFAFYFEKRPGAACLICDPYGYEWGDSKWMSERKGNMYSRGRTVCIGKWRTVDGDFPDYREIAEKLIKNTISGGFTHLILSPVMEYSNDESFGYATSGYFAPTSRFGSPDGFAFLVDSCHKAGLGVIVEFRPERENYSAQQRNKAVAAALFWLLVYHVDGLMTEGGLNADYLRLITRLAAEQCPGAIVADDGFVLTPFGQ